MSTSDNVDQDEDAEMISRGAADAVSAMVEDNTVAADCGSLSFAGGWGL